MPNIVFPNRGLLVSPLSGQPISTLSGFSSGVIDAAGESATAIGTVFLEGGSGSKTISSAGGAIYWVTGAVTFVNAGTTIRVGIQDVGATGLEDGVFDVNGDLVGGTDTISSNAIQRTLMESGSKTINHGDTIAVSIEAISRGGADSIQFSQYLLSRAIPYSTADSGAGPVKSTGSLPITIEFDDGTLGWFVPFFASSAATTTFFSSSSNPDERGLLFSTTYGGIITEITFAIGAVSSTDTLDLVIYSDPLGTPVVEQTITVNPNNFGSAGNTLLAHITLSTPFAFSANTPYCISILPTSTNSITVYHYDFGAGNSILRRPTALGENWSLGTRTDGTGAFAPTTTQLPIIGFYISEIEAGGGGVSTFS